MDKWIVCLKHGTKYNADYVNRLYNMTQRHCTVPHRFACITEDPTNLNPAIKVISLPRTKLQGWWLKPYIFSSEIPLTGTLLFFDLDIVIVKNIDHFWDFHPEKFCIIKDFNRSNIPGWNKFNSSAFKMPKGHFNYVWDKLIADTRQTNKMHGDQDWIFSQVKSNFVYWPDDWIQSYKWEIRSKSDIIRIDNKRNFKDIANPKIKDNTSVLVFHGDPKPSEVKDPIIIDNWQ